MLLFTEAQLRELELQTLVFNHLASGIPIPPHLFAHFKRSLYFLDPYSLSPSSKSPYLSLFHFLILRHQRLHFYFDSELWEESRGGSRAMEVQENWWEEVEVLQGGIPGLKVLREAYAQGEEEFKKACGKFAKNYTTTTTSSKHQFVLGLSFLLQFFQGWREAAAAAEEALLCAWCWSHVKEPCDGWERARA